MSGYGIAQTYKWKEDPIEMEITVQVPVDTQTKDIIFNVKQTSIDLRLKGGDSGGGNGEEKILLDVNREMKGRILLDGTYWVMNDKKKNEGNEETQEDNEKGNEYREIVVTIEKNWGSNKINGGDVDNFDMINYDWGCVYLKNNTKNEIIYKKYDEIEELDVKEYASSLGVDLDNINMSLVDKDMFTSNINMTRSTLDTLHKAGYIQEVTQQSDGSEYISDDDGDLIPLNNTNTANNGVSNRKKKKNEKFKDEEEDEEDHDDQSTAKTTTNDANKIPFLDTSSPWHECNTIPANNGIEEALNGDNDNNQVRNAKEKDDSKKKKKQEKEEAIKKSKDPIDMLTVNKLQEILRQQGLKVTGTKQVLRERLREHVNSMMTK